MSNFGDFLRDKRLRVHLTQVGLSKRLRQNGFRISNSTISYWETGRRLPRDTNRRDLITIGEILNLSAEEKDELLTLVDLAPIQPVGDEEKKAKFEVSETVVEIELPYQNYSYRQYMQESWHNAIFYKSFVLDTLSDYILINIVQVRTSHPDVSYKLMIFEDSHPEIITFRDEEDIIQMDLVSQRVYAWGRGFLVPYQNREGKRQVYGAMGTGKKPIRFDLNEQEFSDYIREPIRYNIRLEYRLQ